MKKTTWLILIVAALVIALDQLSKYLVTTLLPLGGAWSPFPGENPVFRIIYIYNTGVAFGLLKDLGVVSVVIAVIVFGVIVVYSRKLHNDQWFTCLALGLMLGGALGNVVDRLRLGHVIDFIDVGVGTTRWYTSNLADVSIVLGVILLGVATLIDDRRDRKRSHPAEVQTPGAQTEIQ
ncbi:MAG TPA: signal peptidase II [Anaerolineae bacterium]|nr:signal peptidase II [Anaerolineae bacterium]